jgi:hypothetical protein
MVLSTTVYSKTIAITIPFIIQDQAPADCPITILNYKLITMGQGSKPYGKDLKHRQFLPATVKRVTINLPVSHQAPGPGVEDFLNRILTSVHPEIGQFVRDQGAR